MTFADSVLRIALVSDALTTIGSGSGLNPRSWARCFAAAKFPPAAANKASACSCVIQLSTLTRAALPSVEDLSISAPVQLLTTVPQG